jgi:hypothetical protein
LRAVVLVLHVAGGAVVRDNNTSRGALASSDTVLQAGFP